MAFWSKISKSFGLDDEGWMRHANPWSGYTRYTALPLLIISFWSRAWIGWYSLIPITLSIIWAKINPIIFPKPKSTNNWASKCVLGERVWLNDKKIKIPAHHKRAARILTTLSLISSVILIIGVYLLDYWLTILGFSLTFIFKIWFTDRMVWLYEDMKHLKEYKKWLY